MVSDEELEQMLDSGQSEVFVSNVSGHSYPSFVGGRSIPGSWFLCVEGRPRPSQAWIRMLGPQVRGLFEKRG
jgi:hypothetical protein